jgi:NitT/TauT family transport system permease protein
MEPDEARPGLEPNAAVLAGLDALELSPPPGRRGPARGRRVAGSAWSVLWPKLLAIAIVILIWQLVHLTGWKKFVFAGPGATFSSLWDQMHHLLLWQAIGTTMQRALIGFALSVLFGAIVGALVSRIRPLRAAVGSMITGLQTMPSAAWFPFAIILFGLTTQAILFVIVMGSWPSVANGLITGVDYTPPLLLRAAKTMGLRRLALYRHLILPASLPAFVAGLKQGWAFAWRSLLFGELLVQVPNMPSIGVLLNTDQDQLDFADATAIIIVILILGVLVDSVFTKADRAIRSRWGITVN